jgi:hypothetical protein
VDNKFFQQKDGMAVVSPVSSIVNNIYMEHFENLALDSAQHKPSQNFISCHSRLKPTIHFIMEVESDNAITFLDVLVASDATFIS